MQREPSLARNSVIALLFAAGLIAALFLYTHWTFAQFAIWAEQADELTRRQRDMIIYARWWRGFWWLYSPMIVVLCLGCAFFHWFTIKARTNLRR